MLAIVSWRDGNSFSSIFWHWHCTREHVTLFWRASARDSRCSVLRGAVVYPRCSPAPKQSNRRQRCRWLIHAPRMHRISGQLVLYHIPSLHYWRPQLYVVTESPSSSYRVDDIIIIMLAIVEKWYINRHRVLADCCHLYARRTKKERHVVREGVHPSQSP